MHLCYFPWCILLFILICFFCVCLLEWQRDLKSETLVAIFLRLFTLGRSIVPMYEMEIITVMSTCLPEFHAAGSQKIKHMECALWMLTCFTNTRQLLLLSLFSATEIHFNSSTHSSMPTKSWLGSILSYFRRKMTQNVCVLPSLHYYSNDIYSVPWFQQASSYLQFFTCPSNTKFKSAAETTWSRCKALNPESQVYCRNKNPECVLPSPWGLSQQFCLWSNLRTSKEKHLMQEPASCPHLSFSSA